ncbi:origin recognition complex subunit 5 [Brevipalpus obovatus]|uniref:origin recognition complex subunit 5 n=1 Tax=Brevipalpus obovatus TaxID=246614 RepID=UPI003D9E7F31
MKLIDAAGDGCSGGGGGANVSPDFGERSSLPPIDRIFGETVNKIGGTVWPFVIVRRSNSIFISSSLRSLVQKELNCVSWINCLEMTSLKYVQHKIVFDLSCKINKSGSKKRCPEMEFTNPQSFVAGVASLLNNLPTTKVKQSSQRPNDIADLLKASLHVKTPVKSPSRSSPRARKTTPKNLKTSSRTSPKKKTRLFSDEIGPLPARNLPTLNRCFIVFENFESLIEKKIDIHSLMDRVQSVDTLKTFSLSCLLITSLSSDWLKTHLSTIPTPISYELPSLTTNEIAQIIQSQCMGAKYQKSNQFINHMEVVIETTSTSISDVDKILNITVKTFDKSKSNGTTSDFSNRSNSLTWAIKGLESLVAPISTNGTLFIQEMTLAERYLLLASFLASYNSKASDRKFFVVLSDRRRISRRTTKNKQFEKPKAFTLERLIHIYDRIIHLNEDPRSVCRQTFLYNLLFHHIEKFVSLNLLVKVPSAVITSISSLTKYRVSDSVTYEFIEQLAGKIDFDLKSYLEALV